MLKAEYQQRGPQPHEVIAAVALQLPEPGAGQVRIKVLAAPINPSDVLTLTGEYGMLPPLPAIGGNEGVGRVEALGAEVGNLKVGQMVLLPVGCGTWVSHLNAQANKLIPLPEADPQQLAMMTVNPPTASLMLSEFVDLKPGDWVIQNAANSGVGSYLIQLAKLRGFKTINVVRRESAVAAVEAELLIAKPRAPREKVEGEEEEVVEGEEETEEVVEVEGDRQHRLEAHRRMQRRQRAHREGRR